ncbi:MAG: MBL fold metallo-hydrolase [Spirochaetota bacterium]
MDNLLITHGHLDHASGIPYYISQRSLRKLKPPKIYLPEVMYEPMQQILALYSQMEDFPYNYTMQVCRSGEMYPLNSQYSFTSYPTFHRVASQGYTVYETRKKLKAKFQGIAGEEILKLKKQGVEITEVIQIPIVSFSGDTRSDYLWEYEDVRKSKILFMECTYIDEERGIAASREWGHTHLDEIFAKADRLENEKLVLIHFSKRYSNRYIRHTVKQKTPPSLEGRIHCFLPEE